MIEKPQDGQNFQLNLQLYNKSIILQRLKNNEVSGMKDVVKVGLIGFGTVGTGVAGIMLGTKKPFLRSRNFGLELIKIADIDTTTDRGISLPEGILTTDANEILNDPDIDIVIELIGGYEPAKS